MAIVPTKELLCHVPPLGRKARKIRENQLSQFPSIERWSLSLEARGTQDCERSRSRSVACLRTQGHAIIAAAGEIRQPGSLQRGLHSLTSSPSSEQYVESEQQRQTESRADVNVAHPGPYRIGTHVIEAEGGSDQHGILQDHDAPAHAIAFRAPSPIYMQRYQRAYKQEGRHGAAAVQHEQPRCDHLPNIALRAALLPIGG